MNITLGRVQKLKLLNVLFMIFVFIHPIYMSVDEYRRSSLIIKAQIRTWGRPSRSYGGPKDAFSDALFTFLIWLTIDTAVFIMLKYLIESFI